MGLQDQQARDLLGVLPALTAESDEFRLYHQLVSQARETLEADLVVLFPAGAGVPDVPPQSGNRGPGRVAGSPAVQGLVRRVLDPRRSTPTRTSCADVATQAAGTAAAGCAPRHRHAWPSPRWWRTASSWARCSPGGAG